MQTYFSKVDYQRVYVRALQLDEDYSDFIRVEPSAQVKLPPWRYDPSSTKSLVDLQRRSAGRVRILQSKQPLPEDGVLVVIAVYLAKDPIVGASAAISLSRYGSEDNDRSEGQAIYRKLRSYVYEEALRRSLDAVLPQRKDVAPITPTLYTVGNKTHGGGPQVTLSIEYNKGSKLPMSAEQLGNALERSLDELRALVAGKAD